MALDHRKINQAWKKNQAEFFLRSALQNLANKSGCV